ncbi:Uncharacterized protein SCF082_LOCUS26590 [Durusdinium trenchii]|uniref:Uncharacterized protein n=1 Tax=Durusdinium trenchii TaxID=1381693 RepID=A0ABP0M992_9DINO
MQSVEVNTRVELKHGDGKFHPIPEQLLVSLGGKSFLKIRPTSQVIVSLICGKAPKNSSLSSSAALASLIQQRNEKGQKRGSDGGEGAEVFQAGAKKRKVTKPEAGIKEDQIITIDVDGSNVEVLWNCGASRPSRFDLCVVLEPEALAAVFSKLQEDCQACFEASKRAYKKKETSKSNVSSQS